MEPELFRLMSLSALKAVLDLVVAASSLIPVALRVSLDVDEEAREEALKVVRFVLKFLSLETVRFLAELREILPAEVRRVFLSKRSPLLVVMLMLEVFVVLDAIDESVLEFELALATLLVLRVLMLA
jgi:hypothetical protein